MSILHVNQIAGAFHRLFDGKIDLRDGPENKKELEKLFLSRALASFSILQLANATPDEAANAITDGTGDNGIDAIHFDHATKTLYVVQSKWHADGNGSFDRGDMLKFTKGFDDLANQSFERFNKKVNDKEAMINEAFFDDQAHYVMIAADSGVQDLAPQPRSDLDDCLDRFNDTADDDADPLLEARVLKCTIPDDQISPRRSALFMARSALRDIRTRSFTMLIHLHKQATDLPPTFRTRDYLRFCPPNRRGTCASRSSRKSRWWRLCGRRIAIASRRLPGGTRLPDRRSTPGRRSSARSTRTRCGA